MFDEKNVALAKLGLLPPCTGKVNQPMHVFFLRHKREEFSISLDELGLTRGDCGMYPKQLPPSAYNSRSWWNFQPAKDDGRKMRHPNALAWLTAGWYVESLSKDQESGKYKKAVFVPFNLPKTIKK